MTTTPERRKDTNSETAHRELMQKARQGVIDVYFVGDSITRRWGALDYPALLANWTANFFGWNAANFAWGGDRTQNVLWRLANGELENVAPGIFVIQAGTNNLSDFVDDPARIGPAGVATRPGEFVPSALEIGAEAIAAGVRSIVDACRAHAPDATIVVTAIFPRSDQPVFGPVIDAINAKLAAYADGDAVRFVDINDRLAGPDGLLRDSMSDDGLHPSLPAYQLWADALKPVFVEVLGPPADVDLAPAPTGNPAAR